jgi:serine/threonine protein kinase
LNFASDERVIARFRHEALLAKQVTHAKVCRIYDVVFQDPAADAKAAASQSPLMYLSMELLRGETLSARLQQGRMSCAEALPLVEQMTAGLHAAHRAGIVHRDFKSANVMLVDDGDGRTRAVITDFGLALAVQLRPGETLTTSITEHGQIAGTPEYMAPEQILGGEVTPALDIYALGVAMFEMITGRTPFEADAPLEIATKRLHEPFVAPEMHDRAGSKMGGRPLSSDAWNEDSSCSFTGICGAGWNHPLSPR